jgi:glutaredoxin
MDRYFTRIEGDKEDHDITFYGLSTCGWCRKARNFLDEHKLTYRFVYVDLLEEDDQKQALEEVVKVNPRKSFPTIIVDGEKVMIGFNEEKYRESLL